MSKWNKLVLKNECSEVESRSLFREFESHEPGGWFIHFPELANDRKFNLNFDFENDVLADNFILYIGRSSFSNDYYILEKQYIAHKTL